MRLKRRRISSDFVLALSALLISFVIWLIAAEADIETDNLTVSVEVVNTPANYKLEIMPREAIITVQYPKAQKSTIIAPNFHIEIDVNNILEFSRKEAEISTNWLLTTIDVKKSNVSERVKVIEIAQPKFITLKAQMYIEEGEIKPIVIGELKPGYRLAEPPKVRPEKVKVTGPASLLAQLKEQNNGRIVLKTPEIDITEEEHSFFRTVKILLPEGAQLVEPKEEFVQVIFGVVEVEETKIISPVPIEIKTFTQNIIADYNPHEASVEVKAPLSLIKELEGKDFYCEPVQPIQETPGFQGKVAIEAKFREGVAQKSKEKVSILSVRPPAVELTIKQKK